MKRFLLFLFLICIVGTLCSCSKIFSNEEEYFFTATEVHEEATRIKDVFLEAYENKDVNKLYNEFSSYAKENTDLKDKISDAFDYIDGNITTIESVNAGNNASQSDEHGYVRVNYIARMIVKTDTKRNYEIRIHGIYFCRDNEQEQGISRISIFDNDKVYNEVTGEGKFETGPKELE